MNLTGTDTSQLSDKPERERDTFLTAGIFFSLDRCLLMGDPHGLGGEYLIAVETCPSIQYNALGM
jgi:hypothetical protein